VNVDGDRHHPDRHHPDRHHPIAIIRSTIRFGTTAILSGRNIVFIPATVFIPMILATLDLWQKTSGTWINVLAIVLGTAIGQSGKETLPPNMQQIITQGLGLFVVFLGVTMAGSILKVSVGNIDGVILGLLAIVVGGILGEMAQLEARLQHLGDWLKKWTRSSGRFTEGFVAASLLFGVGPMAILGCLNNGLSGNNNLLTIKSIMDGFAAIVFSSSYGIGVGFSALPILIYQGGLSLAAGILAQTLTDPIAHPIVLLTSGVGGLMVLGIGINLLAIQSIPVASFLPALLITPLLYAIADWIN
jgi:uncharacterized protein